MLRSLSRCVSSTRSSQSIEVGVQGEHSGSIYPGEGTGEGSTREGSGDGSTEEGITGEGTGVGCGETVERIDDGIAVEDNKSEEDEADDETLFPCFGILYFCWVDNDCMVVDVFRILDTKSELLQCCCSPNRGWFLNCIELESRVCLLDRVESRVCLFDRVDFRH